MGNANRRKGHALERLIAKTFRLFGFQYSKTSRATSRLLDDCGVDINFVPFLIQCKAGYNNNRPKYEDIYRNIKDKLKENYPGDHPNHDLPIVLIHKLNGRKKELFQWTFRHEDSVEILEDYYKTKNELQKLKAKLADE